MISVTDRFDQWREDGIRRMGLVRAFGELSGELEMAIGITLLERKGEALRNTLVLFDRHGERKLTYAKVHTCDLARREI